MMKKLLALAFTFYATIAVADGVNRAVRIAPGPGVTGDRFVGPGATGTVLGGNGGSTDPTFKTLTAVFDAICSAPQGSIIYRGASAWVCTTGIVVTATAIGIGATPTASLTVGQPIGGTAASATFLATSGTLGTTATNEIALGNFGFFAGANSTSLGFRAYRVSNGTDWTTAAVVLGLDVDNVVRQGGALWLYADGRAGVGGGTYVSTPASIPITNTKLSGIASGSVTWIDPVAVFQKTYNGTDISGVQNSTLFVSGRKLSTLSGTKMTPLVVEAYDEGGGAGSFVEAIRAGGTLKTGTTGGTAQGILAGAFADSGVLSFTYLFGVESEIIQFVADAPIPASANLNNLAAAYNATNSVVAGAKKSDVAYLVNPFSVAPWRTALFVPANSIDHTVIYASASVVDGVNFQNAIISGSAFKSPGFSVNGSGLIAGTTSLALSGSSSGVVTTAVQAAAGTFNFNLPITAGTSGFALVSGGGGATPMAWAAVQPLDAALTSIAGVSWVQGDTLYWSGTDVAERLAKDTNSTRALCNTGTSNNPAWCQISLTTGVTGVLPGVNGGTGLSTAAVGDLIYASATTPTWARLAAVAVGSVLTSNGTGAAPVWRNEVGIGGAAISGRTLTLSSAAQPTFAFYGANGAVGKKVLGLLYDAGVSLTQPGIVIQDLDDTGGFVGNKGAIWRDAAVTLGSITYPGEAGSFRTEAQIYAPNIPDDTALTDNTLCLQTGGGGKFLKGSGALGICLGTSGRQFKQAFKPMQAGLAEIAKLPLWNYRYKPGFGDNGAREQYGPTAQDVAKVLPDLVRYDEAGNAINYDWGSLLLVSLHAVQELKADNDNMRQEIEQLKKRAANGR